MQQQLLFQQIRNPYPLGFEFLNLVGHMISKKFEIWKSMHSEEFWSSVCLAVRFLDYLSMCREKL